MVVGSILNVRVAAQLPGHSTLLRPGDLWRRVPLPLTVRLALTDGALLRLRPVLIPILLRHGPLDRRGGVGVVGHANAVPMMLRAALGTSIVSWRLALLGVGERVRVPEVALGYHEVGL